MRQSILFWVLAAFVLALPAQAANEGHYPSTIVDANCTDARTTPAAAGQTAARPEIQISGTADGYCDHDSRIRKSAITADTTFGPFTMPPGSRGILLFVDADTVSNDTDTWSIDLAVVKPDSLAKVVVDSTASQATEGDKSFGFVPALMGADTGAATGDIDVFVPKQFYLVLNLGTATSWAGSISWVAF